MDVLYVVRGDRPELRYSLRSMERNASNVGRVVVAGTDLPGWLSDEVERVEVPSPFDRKQKNILFAVLSAMGRGAVRGPALYSSDDHYHLAPVDFDAYPWFARPCGYTLPELPTAYRMSVFMTGPMLLANGLPHARRLDGHWNTHIDSADFTTVMRATMGFERTRWGYEPTTPFVAAAIARGACPGLTFRHDRKLTAEDVAEGGVDFDEAAGESLGLFSSIPLGKAPRFRAWLETRFPEPCRWEKR